MVGVTESYTANNQAGGVSGISRQRESSRKKEKTPDRGRGRCMGNKERLIEQKKRTYFKISGLYQGVKASWASIS